MSMTKDFTKATKRAVSSRLAATRSRLDMLRADQSGASFVEYVIVVGLVAIISIVAFQNFGQAIVTKLGEETTAVTGLQISGGAAGAPAAGP
jgi:Flp pilus assembly pilin Flp